MVILLTSSCSSKTEFAYFFYCVFNVGGFTSLFRGRVLTIFSWDFSNLLLIDVYINIVLAHVFSFPTNLVSLNSESVCKSCGCFGKGCSGTTATRADVNFYYRSRAVLPRLLQWQYRSGPKSRIRSSGGRHGCNFLEPLASSSTASPSSSTMRTSGSTALCGL